MSQCPVQSCVLMICYPNPVGKRWNYATQKYVILVQNQKEFGCSVKIVQVS